MNGRFYVTTSEPARRRTWQRIFGSERLPVLHPSPRVVEVHAGSVPAYDLALAALSDAQRMRLAAHVARRPGWDYFTARLEIETAVAWPLIDNGDLHVEQAVEQNPLPVFLGNWPLGNKGRPVFVGG